MLERILRVPFPLPHPKILKVFGPKGQRFLTAFSDTIVKSTGRPPPPPATPTIPPKSFQVLGPKGQTFYIACSDTRVKSSGRPPSPTGNTHHTPKHCTSVRVAVNSAREPMFTLMFLHNHTTPCKSSYIVMIPNGGPTNSSLTTTPTNTPIKS